MGSPVFSVGVVGECFYEIQQTESIVKAHVTTPARNVEQAFTDFVVARRWVDRQVTNYNEVSRHED